MKNNFTIIIASLLLIVIGFHLLPIYYYPHIKDSNSIADLSSHYLISELFLVSFSFILCGWLAWLIFKLELYKKMLQEKETDAKREDSRQEKLEQDAKAHGAFEMERNRINDLIRIAQVSLDKSETYTSVNNTLKVTESIDTENITTNTNDTKNELVNFEIFTNIFREYQNILKNPINDIGNV